MFYGLLEQKPVDARTEYRILGRIARRSTRYLVDYTKVSELGYASQQSNSDLQYE
jgi:hypothetical protein